METEKTTPEEPIEETVKKPIVKPDTDGPHDCPKGYVWNGTDCVADVG